MQSAMNFIKRRFSDTNFNANLPNGYMVDSEEGVNENEVFSQRSGPEKEVATSQNQLQWFTQKDGSKMDQNSKPCLCL